MIKYLKIGEDIYQNIDTKMTIEKVIREAVVDDETGEVIEPPVVEYDIVNNTIIPADIEELRTKTIDTLNWLIGQTVKQNTGGNDYTKLSAANSKAVALLAKVITSLNPDTSNLSAKELEAFTKLQTLAQNGYADSDLLNRSLDAVINNIQKYTTLIDQAVKATTKEELVGILESV